MAGRSAAYGAAPRQAKTVKQLLTERCRQCGRGGWMSENISGVPAGRSVFHLTSPFIGLTDQRSISNIWHEGAVPLLSGGRILAAVDLAYKSYQRLAKPRDTPAQRRASTETVENCNHFAIT
jgi:hypothetical protein